MSTRQSASAIRVNNAVEDRQTALAFNGYPVLILGFILLGWAGYDVYSAFQSDRFGNVLISWASLGAAAGLFVLVNVVFFSIYSLQPNEAKVQTLFGSYIGTDTVPGLRATIPLFTGRSVSQRVRYHECQTLKVNDLIGNPIEIGAVVVWRVDDCAKAVFQIEDFKAFVGAQTESALRHIAGAHPYDFDEASSVAAEEKPAAASAVAGRVLSLRESGAQVSDELVAELKERLAVAGITVDEARITHLAYAPEIAPVMLRRQQASAVIAARKQVVQGAVEIVKDAIEKLKENAEIDLDPERKAAMVSNLLVVLVSDKDATPVVNTGTLYG